MRTALVGCQLKRLWHTFRARPRANLADAIAIPRHSDRLSEGEAMELATLLPHFADVRVTHTEFLPDEVIVEARVRAAGAPCPDCRRRSRRVHSRYTRKIADRSIGERRVTVHLQVRRFHCRAAHCPRRTFAEALSTKVGPGGSPVCGGIVRPGGLATQAMAGVPVTARQVAKRSSLIWR